MSKFLSLANVNINLSGHEVLRDISVSLDRGSFTGLVGPNAAGKSTLLRCIAGLIEYSGTIELHGQKLSGMSRQQRAKMIGFLPQTREIGWPLAVRRIVELGRIPFRSLLGATSPHDDSVVTAAMQRTDTIHLADRPATQLSGGEQARVLIARALAQETPLLLADEPTAGLDPAHGISIASQFHELARSGVTVLASFHDLGLAARWCERILVLHQGMIQADGSPATALTPQCLRHTYGIEAYIAQDEAGMVLLPTELCASASHA